MSQEKINEAFVDKLLKENKELKAKNKQLRKASGTYIDHRGNKQTCDKDSFIAGTSFGYLQDDY